MPVYGTQASRFNDDGVTALYQHLVRELSAKGLVTSEGLLAPVATKEPTGLSVLVPPARVRYLSEVTETKDPNIGRKIDFLGSVESGIDPVSV